MPTYRTLIYSSHRPPSRYYRDPVTGDPIICAKGLRRYVDLPTPCPEIRVVTTGNPPHNEEYFDITTNGTIIGVGDDLTADFMHWLQHRYWYGDKYMYFTYKE